MEIDNNYHDNCSKIEMKKSLVFNFPYSELLNVSPANMSQIRKCLPYLLEISKLDLFYTNVKAVRYTLEFATTTLSNFDDMSAKDSFVKLLVLLKEILLRCSKLDDLFPDTHPVFDVLLYVSDFDIFCTYCSNVCEPILLQLLNSFKHQDYRLVDTALAGILENFKEIKANKQVANISEVILLRFPLESKSYKLSAYWLMEDSIKILKDLEINRIEDELRIITIIRNIYLFFMKVDGSVTANPEMVKYHESIMRFVNDLMQLSPKLINLCCTRSIEPEAKKLLGLVLHAFLREQGMISHDIGMVANEEIEEFPLNVKEWPKHFSRTFFWICHLLYYYKRWVWTSEEICDAIIRLIYTKKYEKALNVHVLKSVCYIFPLTVQGYSRTRRGRLISDDILDILPRFSPLLNRILSVSKCQLFWLMYKASSKVKMATLLFWFEKSLPENVCILKEAIIATKSEKLLIDILLTMVGSNCSTVQKAIEVMQSLPCTTLPKELPKLIYRFSGSIEVVILLIQACCNKIPQDKNINLIMFNFVTLLLRTNPNDDTLLATVCLYVGNLLTALKTDIDFIHSICTNQFWIRYPISRIDEQNDKLVIAILELLTKILTYQKKPCYTNDPALIDLAPLLKRATNVIEKAITFLCLLLQKKTLIKLKEESIISMVYNLYDLTDDSCLSTKAYGCLRDVLKFYSSELINFPVLGRLIEERCHFSNRKNHFPACVKFVLLWIKLMHKNPTKSFCFLPKKDILTKFIKRSNGLLESTVNRYQYFISKIYYKENYDYEDDDDTDKLSKFFNFQLNID